MKSIHRNSKEYAANLVKLTSGCQFWNGYNFSPLSDLNDLQLNDYKMRVLDSGKISLISKHGYEVVEK